jgi:flagellar capping protein FliD
MNASDILRRLHKEEARLELINEELSEKYGIQKPTTKAIESKLKDLDEQRQKLRKQIDSKLKGLRTKYPEAMGDESED